MASVTAFTAARMLEIENTTVVNASLDVNGNLTLITREGTLIPLGSVRGLPGEPGTNGINGINGTDGESVVYLDAAESSAGLPDGTKICRRYP